MDGFRFLLNGRSAVVKAIKKFSAIQRSWKRLLFLRFLLELTIVYMVGGNKKFNKRKLQNVAPSCVHTAVVFSMGGLN